MGSDGYGKGLSYFIYAPGGHDGPEPPVIESIKVNKRKGIIEISANGSDSIVWISGGEVVHRGATIDLNNTEELSTYVRAKLYGPGDTVTGTQPFGIRQH